MSENRLIVAMFRDIDRSSDERRIRFDRNIDEVKLRMIILRIIVFARHAL